MSAVSGVHQVVFALHEHGQDMEREVSKEMHSLAGRAALRMKELASKGANSNLVTAIRPVQIDNFTWDIGPNPEYVGTNGERPFIYGHSVENGIKPGGKGLPRYLDANGGDLPMLAWLKAMPDKAGAKLNRDHLKTRGKGGRVFNAATESLRNRYFGMANHIRLFGVKAHPFVEPTAREMAPIVLSSMNDAVRRVLAARPDVGGALA